MFRNRENRRYIEHPGVTMARNGQKPPSQRQLRVSEEIRHILSSVLLQEDIFDEDLKGVTVMVTEVRISPDLGVATAFVRPLGDADVDVTVAALNRVKGFFRKFMGKNLDLRTVPDIRFLADRSFDESAKIEALFRNPKVAADVAKED